MEVPRDVHAKDFKAQAPLLTAPGGPLHAYAAASGTLSDASGLADQLKDNHEVLIHILNSGSNSSLNFPILSL